MVCDSDSGISDSEWKSTIPPKLQSVKLALPPQQKRLKWDHCHGSDGRDRGSGYRTPPHDTWQQAAEEDRVPVEVEQRRLG